MRTTIPMAPSSNYSCHIFRQQGSLSPFFKTSRSSHQVNLCSSIFKSRNLLLLKGGFQPKTSTSLEGSLNEIEYKNGLFINEIPKDLSASYFPLSNMLKVLIGIGSFSSGMLAIGKLSKVTLAESILKKVLVFTVAVSLRRKRNTENCKLMETMLSLSISTNVRLKQYLFLFVVNFLFDIKDAFHCNYISDCDPRSIF